MSKRNVPDVNTPENYDEIYFGPRTAQLKSYPYIVEVLKKLNNGGKVLDIGCGVGRYFYAFDGCEIHGTELSLKAIEDVKEKYPEAKVIQWFAGNPLPYEDNTFDLVWCGEFLEHVNSPQQTIDEVNRVLKKGGHALFITPVENNSECPEHLWFFDDADISWLFHKYDVEVEKVHDETRYQIILTKE